MLKRLFFSLRRLDFWLLGATILLVCGGLLMLYSIAFGDFSVSSFLFRQILFFAFGLLFLLGLSSLNYRYYEKICAPFYMAAVFLLLAVLLFGLNVKGGTRWFYLGFFQFQPVELTKLALIIFLAGFFKKNIARIGEFKTVILSGAFTAVPVLLTLVQPDLGSAAVLVLIWLGLLAAAGAKRSHLIALLAIMAFLAAAAWFYLLKDYQKLRLLTFFNPTSDPLGRGYNAMQAVVAVGSGGLFGRGLARGVVSQLRFLPERQTDFIFATLAEELGLVGVLFLMALFATWFFRIVKIIKSSRDNFGAFLATGILIYLFSQTVINIGMNIGLLPITGIPLPLVSYGGSSLLIIMMSVGILQNISANSQPARFD